MIGLNKVTLIGHIGQDPEHRVLEGSTTVAKFTLATTESFKHTNGEKQSTTEWHNIVVWNNLADMAHSYLRKGSLIYLEGKIKTRSYGTANGEKRYVTEIISDYILMLDKAKGGLKEQRT
jgi:single-strand DNA-binding protein